MGLEDIQERGPLSHEVFRLGQKIDALSGHVEALEKRVSALTKRQNDQIGGMMKWFLSLLTILVVSASVALLTGQAML